MINAASFAARVFPGLILLNSGLGKRKLDAESAAGLQGFASTGIPAVTKLDPKTFRGEAMTYYGRWTYKYETAAAHGAAAVLLMSADKAA